MCNSCLGGGVVCNLLLLKTTLRGDIKLTNSGHPFQLGSSLGDRGSLNFKEYLYEGKVIINLQTSTYIQSSRSPMKSFQSPWVFFFCSGKVGVELPPEVPSHQPRL